MPTLVSIGDFFAGAVACIHTVLAALKSSRSFHHMLCRIHSTYAFTSGYTSSSIITIPDGDPRFSTLCYVNLNMIVLPPGH